MPPMYLLAKKLIEAGKRPTVILGFNTASEMFYEEEFKALGAEVKVTTADGTYGIKGFVTAAMGEEYSYFYACGPEAMLKGCGGRVGNRRAAELRGENGLWVRSLHGMLLRDFIRQQENMQGRPGAEKGRSDMAEMKVNLCGITLNNPVMAASGTFGYGYEFAELYDINRLGTFSFKGTTAKPRFGNPTPRIAECTAGMINSVGLQNPGVDKVIEEELPKLAKCFDKKKVMANVSGFSTDEYVEICRKLDPCDQIGWLEVNISCPNVHGGGMAFGTCPEAAAEVTREVRKVTKSRSS